MTKILPSVGRIVLFTPSHVDASTLVHHDRTKPLASIVTHVWNDAMVNLTVFDSNGAPHSRTSVAMVQEGEPKPEHGYFCTWMAYQTGQAAKTEKLQAQLDSKTANRH
jgi:hypothetical protein